MDHSPDAAWARLLACVRQEHPELYRAWFDSLSPGTLDGGRLLVTARDRAQARYLRDHCTPAFTNAAMATTGYLVTVHFLAEADGDLRGELITTPPALTQVPLNPDYTFPEFVVGPSNQLAHAACQAVFKQPGALYNPLFIHGRSGLGKSHLLQATCAAVLEENPDAEVSYVNCETFVNDYVKALADGSVPAFRNAARRSHVLVIDDIQFLAHSEACQDELFHTFNTLYQMRRQIILSADSPPAEIPTLEDRLVSRFTWGLVAQIDPPNRETRAAILQKKAKLRGIDIPPTVIDFIARHVEGNIRLLEGALNKLLSEAQLNGKPLDLETTRAILPTFERAERRVIPIGEIVKAVAKHYHMKPGELIGRKRTRSVSQPRQLAMFLARQLTEMSLVEIGNHFGGRDHSTVVHAEQSVTESAANDPELEALVQSLTTRLLTRA